jgi:hypothetical protein
LRVRALLAEAKEDAGERRAAGGAASDDEEDDEDDEDDEEDEEDEDEEVLGRARMSSEEKIQLARRLAADLVELLMRR